MTNSSPTAFKFIHAADLHLGSPLVGLALKDAEVARRFAAAGRQAFTDLVSYAIESRVAFLVLAGDVYDGDWKDASIGLFFNREVARLHRSGIPVFVVKGNHDADSVVTRSVRLPDTVQTFPNKAPATFRIEELKVAVHGRSFPERAVTENYACDYPAPVPGWFNIGVLHTACDGRPGHASYAPCTLQDLVSRGYQYWALGHVHEHEVLWRDPLVVYPGNLQGRSIRECGAKGAVVVHVSDGHATLAEHVAFDSARFGALTVGLDGLDTESDACCAISEQIAKVAATSEGRLLALRVTLRGSTPLHRRFHADVRRLTEDVQAILHHHHEDIWLEALRIETSEPVTPANSDASQLVDLAGILSTLHQEPEVIAAASSLLAQLIGKLPGTIDNEQRAFLGDPASLLKAASSLVLGRLTAREC